jgi:Domain of unknown function (DUF4389)
MKAGKIILLVFGVIVLLAGVGLLMAGGTLVWADKTLKDDDGFITTDTVHLEKSSYAIITHPADIDLEGRWPWGRSDLATIKVEASNNTQNKQIFIGIADSSDIEDYLSGIEYDEITEFRIHPFRLDYRNNPGSSVPAEPVSQTFWKVSAYGAGIQTLEWEMEKGSWVLVLMNTDGSAGIDLSGSIGIKATWIFGLGIGLLIGGIIALIAGIFMTYFAVHRSLPVIETNMLETSNIYPVSLSVDYPDKALNRLSTFFRVILLVPIAIILSLVSATAWGRGYGCSHLFASGGLLFLPIVLMLLFRQKYPRWWFEWNVALTKFSARVFAYFALLRDEYPSTDEEQAVHIDIVYPDAKKDLSRWLPLVKWFLAIPHYIILFFLGIAAFVCIILAWFAILFTGHYPRSLFDFVVSLYRWSLRVAAYAFLLTTDRYPPFRLTN